MKDILTEAGESSLTVDVVEKVFFNNLAAEVLRHRIGEQPFGRGLVPKDLMSDARFGGSSSAGSTPLTGDELKAVVNCLREAAVDGSVQTIGFTDTALEFCNCEGWLQRIRSGMVEKFEVPPKVTHKTHYQTHSSLSPLIHSSRHLRGIFFASEVDCFCREPAGTRQKDQPSL